MTTITIGRHNDCGIVLSHPSVSRHHAELVIGANAEYKLVDTNSKFGTFVRSRGSADWQKVSAVRLERGDQLRFGRFDTDVDALLALLPQKQPGKVPPRAAVGSAPVERNPETGEIVNRRNR